MSDFYDLNSPCLNAHLSREAMGSPFHVIICISWACVCIEYSCNILKVVRHVAASSSMAQCLRRLGDNGTQSICLKKGSSLEWRHSWMCLMASAYWTAAVTAKQMSTWSEYSLVEALGLGWGSRCASHWVSGPGQMAFPIDSSNCKWKHWTSTWVPALLSEAFGCVQCLLVSLPRPLLKVYLISLHVVVLFLHY